MITAKDLTKEAPTSPRTRVAGYAILARMLDKGRSMLAGKMGDYHYACPLDQILLGFKNINGEEILELIKEGKTNEEIGQWLDSHGTPKTEAEKAEWCAQSEAYTPYTNPEKKEWFISMCEQAKIDPATSSLFDWLEVDDKLSFQ